LAEVKVVDVTPKGWGTKLIASFLVETDESVILIETGPAGSYDQLKQALIDNGVEPDIVILTHIHLDHAGAAGLLARDYPRVKILVHPRGRKHMANPSKLWNAAQMVLGEVARIYGEPLPVPEGNLVAVDDGYEVRAGSSVLKIVHTPGHASHHMSILLQPEGILFTGDSAGVVVEVNGRRIELPTTPPPFHPKLYVESIDKMISLKPSKPAPTHYGILDEDAVEYLEREKDRATRWYGLVRDLVAKGLVDVEAVASRLAESYEDARIAYGSPNPIIREVFYKGTVWGLVEAAKKELGKIV